MVTQNAAGIITSYISKIDIKAVQPTIIGSHQHVRFTTKIRRRPMSAPAHMEQSIYRPVLGKHIMPMGTKLSATMRNMPA
eukprot:45282-Eustigmatos_ZCMA.PRE.1